VTKQNQVAISLFRKPLTCFEKKAVNLPAMKKVFFLWCFFLSALLSGQTHKLAVDSAIHCRQHEIVFRLKPEYRDMAGNPEAIYSLQKIVADLGTIKVKPLFKSQAPSTPRTPAGEKLVDLSLIYSLHYSADIEPAEVALRLGASGAVLYAEPFYIQESLLIPNDPQLSSQYFLGKIQAYAGWDISQGDTNTVIGIVDSGTDWDHPDLAANIELNYADPINGIDDDNDGFIDNFRGWDVSENDNDPMVVSQRHGSHVSGCASAVTDNGTGVAGPGFRCRILPVKACYDVSTTTIDQGYEGIVYAADHGCSVINCSWGRRGGPSQFEQDVIDYASFNHNALVVAAAGNQGSTAEFYPASYEHVLSVTSTDQNDLKSSFSNHNFKVDVSAPGDSIFTAIYNDSYEAQSGTSMAAPVVSGCAAVVKSFNPGFTSAQVGARLRATSDDIYSLGANGSYAYQLGKGRINLFKALTDTLSPGIEVSNLSISDHNDEAYVPGDTLRISAMFRNLLHATSALSVTLSSASSYASVLSGNYSIGVLNTFDSISNQANPFAVRILNAPLNTPVDFVMTIADGSYNDYYAFRITVNIDYINVTVNDISTSVSSRGRFGYNKSNQLEGLGFTYLSDQTLLFEGGLMVGSSSSKVSDCVMGAVAGTDDFDFASITLLLRKPSLVSVFYADGIFDDAVSTTPLFIDVTQNVYAWDNDPYRKFIILKYAIRNTGAATMPNLYAGLFADWDIPNYENNKCSADIPLRMGFTWSTDTSLYTGIQLLSPGNFFQYAIDNDSSGLGGVNFTDGFTTAEKYVTLSTNRFDAGVWGTGKDVVDIVSSGPFNIAPGDTAFVAFALLAGDSLASLRASAGAAQHLYDSLLTAIPVVYTDSKFGLDKIYPNPVTEKCTVTFHLDDYGMTTLDLMDISGRKISRLLSDKLAPGVHHVDVNTASLSAGCYLLRLTSDNRVAVMKMTVIRK
jgi:serine protease